ncbi:putative baseplate assembly protein [Danxiaibacter flavus]|uniref:Baseplate assembly protein n=1 Tax=Danxiaibacter flavus TaxID=3049108 RepID=A0ABV3ZE59_9BACT|nr:putative baseplate assembly protein [Chitinophagaceae bacterium DXS]
MDTCHCCEGLSVQTPVEIYNRAGLNAIAYRVGTHPQFKESLLARLSLADQPTLKNLTTREDNDFSIALLDAWSVVSDVLTFYQERIANESYLATATERFSILQLARLIGYELRPGVAATAYIAFTLDDSASALGPVLPSNNLTGLLQSLPPITIDKGIKLQSIPGPGEKAQTFETVENISARAEWNNIKPRLTQPQDPLVETDNIILLKGTNLNLKKGDILRVNYPDNGIKLKTIFNIVVDNDARTTRLNLKTVTTLPNYRKPVFAFGNLAQILNPVLLNQNVVFGLVNKVAWKESDFNILVNTNRWVPKDVYQSINTQAAGLPPETESSAFVFRKRAPVFGYNAQKKITYNGNIPNPPSSWTEWDISGIEKNNIVYLDNAYEEIVDDSYIAIQNPDATNPSVSFYKVNAVNVTSRTEYGMSTKTTKLSIDSTSDWWGSGTTLASLRSIVVYAQSEQLDLAELPIEDEVTGVTLTLDRYYPGLREGQAIIISGERSDLQGVSSSELLFIKTVEIIGGFTELTFVDPGIQYSYIRKTVAINANVAMATHGETVQEVLGNGDASTIFQTFKLKQPPLTFITADTDSGVQSTLEIRVNDLLWHEVPYFLDHGQDERIYITRQDNDSNTIVTFGDGINGARVPTGLQNIKATYRKGIGTGGLVKANQLSQLQTKPLGVKSAINPVSANGAQDAEQLDSARNNASLTILTLGRVVSLQDYEDFARAFAGIEKTLATWTLVNGRRHVYITVAGTDGAEVPEDSKLGINLLAAINKAGDPRVAIKIASYSPRYFQISANVVVDPDYIAANVIAAVEKNLRDTFSFKARKFAQSVTYSEVVACMQQTPGVIAVNINSLVRSEDPATNIPDVIDAAMPVITTTSVKGAELLTLDPRPVDLKVIS